MANDTYTGMWRALRLWSPSLPVTLAQQFIRNRFREILEKRQWSWRTAESQILTQQLYNTGTVAVVNGLSTVLGTNTFWGAPLVGRQFRVGTTAPIYTVVSVDDPTHLQLDQNWGGATAASLGYQIFDGYFTPPADFQDWVVVRDVAFNRQLYTHITQELINWVDSYRAFSGIAYALVDFRFTQNPIAGQVIQPVQVVGSGPAPSSGGPYTGRTDSVFVITVTLGGDVNTAQFSWRKDSGTINAGNISTEQPFQMQEGVFTQWPANQTYVLNDVFVIKVRQGLNFGVPQFELWPYQLSQRVYPFLYIRRVPDLDDSDGSLPYPIRGDIIVKGALADVCRWAGTPDQKNPMFNIALAQGYEAEFQSKVAEMEREDDGIYETDVKYAFLNLPYSPAPWGSADWLQKHDSG